MKMHSARMNMITQQIRTCHVFDEKILHLFASIPREDFVPVKYRRLAFADLQLPIDHDQVMMSPQIEAHVMMALSIKPSDKILEIGTGTGYFTALLAKSSQHVYSIDLFDDFICSASMKLKQLNLDNVTLQQANACEGFKEQEPYDVICITGSLPIIPNSLRYQLKIGGRLFVITGLSSPMQAVLITRTQETEWEQKILFETAIKPLLKIIEPEHFQF